MTVTAPHESDTHLILKYGKPTDDFLVYKPRRVAHKNADQTNAEHSRRDYVCMPPSRTGCRTSKNRQMENVFTATLVGIE